MPEALASSLVFREIPYGSPCYQEECQLRDALLRQPLGLSLFEEDLSAEVKQWHFGLFAEDATLVACGVVHPIDSSRAKVRQVAVVESWQGQGVGARLMAAIESHLLERGFEQVVLHARRDVSPFYLRCGYKQEGEEFLEVGLPHLKMAKSLMLLDERT